jgi:hypothetical protein
MKLFQEHPEETGTEKVLKAYKAIAASILLNGSGP